jgi:hypothetical protein
MHFLEKNSSLETGQGQLVREMVEQQLALLVGHQSLRSSKRSVSFLDYVVRKTLRGESDQLKERTIGVAVFDRDPDYDTKDDHIVRTAATELRKRLAVYYREDAHRTQLRINIPSGSYVPQFTFPDTPVEPENRHDLSAPDPTQHGSEVSHANKSTTVRNYRWLLIAPVSCAILLSATAFLPRHRETETPQMIFWGPVIREPGPAVIVVPVCGPPVTAPAAIKEISASRSASQQETRPPFPMMPVCEAFTMARVTSVFAKADKPFVFRAERTSSFSDLQAGPAVLLGLFSNEWTLRLTRELRFSPVRDPDRNQLYIRDSQNPGSRAWAVDMTEQPEAARGSGKSVPDYVLISRIVSPDTGKMMVIMGGLRCYGSEAAGQFLGDPQLENLTGAIPLDHPKRNLQIVLETNVTEGVPGRPKIVAYSLQ